MARAELTAAASAAWHRYSTRLRAETTEALGIGWDPLPDDPAIGATDEVRVVGLPHVLHVTGGGSGVCRGYLGPHEQIMAADARRASRPKHGLRLGDLGDGATLGVAHVGLDHDHRAADLQRPRHRLDVPSTHTAQEVVAELIVAVPDASRAG